MAQLTKITPCLWFDTEAEDAANFYSSVFKNSKVKTITRYTDVGPHEAGMVLTVEFELDGQPFTALNGGPEFTFSEAISFQVSCDDQAEVDLFWSELSDGGEEGQCGWLKDRFGVSWQIVPSVMIDLITGPKADQVIKVMMGMKKLDIAELEAAAKS